MLTLFHATRKEMDLKISDLVKIEPSLDPQTDMLDKDQETSRGDSDPLSRTDNKEGDNSSDLDSEQSLIIDVDNPTKQNKSGYASDKDSEQPLVIDVANILQQGIAEKLLNEPMQVEVPEKPTTELPFKCCTCPKRFASRIQRLMHEKLHNLSRGFLPPGNKSKMKMRGSVNALPASTSSNSSESLLCSKCNVYFRTSTVKQEHNCPAAAPERSKKPPLLKKTCVTCSKQFMCEKSTIKKCLSCLRSGKRQLASEEIREINGQKVKVIKVNNLDQLTNFDTSARDAPSTSMEAVTLPAKKKKKKRKMGNVPQPQPARTSGDLEIAKRKKKKVRGKGKKQKQKMEAERKEKEAQSVFHFYNSQPSPPTVEEPTIPEAGPKIKFVCCYCDASFIFPNTLKTHSLENHFQFYYCSFCFIMFPSRKQLEIHKTECGNVKIDPKTRDSLKFIFNLETLTCTKCNEAFNTETGLLDHALSKHNKSTSNTSLIVDVDNVCCNASFCSKESLVNHKKEIHKALTEVTVTLGKPPSSHKSFSDFISSSLNSIEIMSFKCTHCPLVSYSARAQRKHLVYDHKIAP